MKKMVRRLLIIFLVFSLFITSFSIYSKDTHKEIISKNSSDGITLTIVTRHDTTITNEFASRFLATPEAIALNITNIDFRQATTDDGWKKLLEDPSKSVDIAWGGGPALFDKMDKMGLLYHINPINDSELFTALNQSVPSGNMYVRLKSLSDTGDLIWAANTISSYGFIVNHDFLDTYGLPIPSTWEELATPTYFINNNVKALAVADPPLSTTHTRIFQIILQAFGWEEGWRIITRMAANADIYPSSVDLDARASVVTGEVGICPSIDFYGVFAHRENPNCEYIIPEGESILSGDPIALGANVDDYEAAGAFIKYVSSPEGQATWLIPGIDHLPVNNSAFTTPEGKEYIPMYEIFNNTLAAFTNIEQVIFNETLAIITLDASIYYFHETLTSPYSLLREAWGKMINGLRNEEINESEFVSLANILTAPCLSLQQAIDLYLDFHTNPYFIEPYRSEWRACAKNRYNAVLDYFAAETTTPSNSSQIKTITFGIITSIVTLLLIRKKKRN